MNSEKRPDVCLVPGCDKGVKTGIFCQQHYNRAYYEKRKTGRLMSLEELSEVSIRRIVKVKPSGGGRPAGGLSRSFLNAYPPGRIITEDDLREKEVAEELKQLGARSQPAPSPPLLKRPPNPRRDILLDAIDVVADMLKAWVTELKE
jgi:hypothetical protein